MIEKVLNKLVGWLLQSVNSCNVFLRANKSYHIVIIDMWKIMLGDGVC